MLKPYVPWLRPMARIRYGLWFPVTGLLGVMVP
ncbi:UNVERIFIED_CONTAM: hypothetical protein GTU68_007825 [Idotea baltica]|nr:hypothetical protein [Idotea baltica]